MEKTVFLSRKTMKISRKIWAMAVLVLGLMATAASCEGGKGCDCPKFGAVAENGNDALASKAAAGTLE